MSARVWFRIASGLLLVFAIGHTYGFLTFRPPTPDGQAVWQAMNATRMTVGRSSFSYAGFYIGFGLFVTVFMLFLAWLAWTLGALSHRPSPGTASLAWSMVAFESVSIAISLRYFSAPPALFSILTAVSLAMGAMRLRTPSLEIS